jgi:hypothetical protein
MQYNNNSKLLILFYLIFSVAVFAFSLLFSEAYQLGDQIFYRQFYAALAHSSIEDVSPLQLIYTGSGEPLYGLIAWIGAKLSISKDVYFSIINSILCLVTLIFLLRNTAAPIYIFLIFANYYLFVLFGPAERLKVAFLFTTIAAATTSKNVKYAALSSALLCHFQTFILLGSRVFGLISMMHIRHLKKKKIIVSIAIGGIASIILVEWFFWRFSSLIFEKLEAYRSNHGAASISNILILMVLSIFILKRRFDALLTLSACSIAAIIVGPERVNMIAFTLFSYFTVIDKRTGHPAVIALMIYFAIKGVIFVADVFMRGTGF